MEPSAASRPAIPAAAPCPWPRSSPPRFPSPAEFGPPPMVTRRHRHRPDELPALLLVHLATSRAHHHLMPLRRAHHHLMPLRLRRRGQGRERGAVRLLCRRGAGEPAAAASSAAKELRGPPSPCCPPASLPRSRGTDELGISAPSASPSPDSNYLTTTRLLSDTSIMKKKRKRRRVRVESASPVEQGLPQPVMNEGGKEGKRGNEQGGGSASDVTRETKEKQKRRKVRGGGGEEIPEEVQRLKELEKEATVLQAAQHDRENDDTSIMKKKRKRQRERVESASPVEQGLPQPVMNEGEKEGKRGKEQEGGSASDVTRETKEKQKRRKVRGEEGRGVETPVNISADLGVTQLEKIQSLKELNEEEAVLQVGQHESEYDGTPTINNKKKRKRGREVRVQSSTPGEQRLSMHLPPPVMNGEQEPKRGREQGEGSASDVDMEIREKQKMKGREGGGSSVSASSSAVQAMKLNKMQKLEELKNKAAELRAAQLEVEKEAAALSAEIG